jgi:hypothetical protein
MKNNIYIVCFLIIIGVTSCSKDFLDEELYSSYNPTELNDELGLNAALVGLQNQYSVWQTFMQLPGGAGQGWLGCWQIGTDVAYNRSPADLDPWCVPFTNYENLTPTDPAVLFTWDWAYKIINNANSIIVAAEDPDNKVVQATKDKINGEAKFYRAFAYNTLVTLYGSVPMITTIVDGPKTDFTKASLASSMLASVLCAAAKTAAFLSLCSSAANAEVDKTNIDAAITDETAILFKNFMDYLS